MNIGVVNLEEAEEYAFDFPYASSGLMCEKAWIARLVSDLNYAWQAKQKHAYALEEEVTELQLSTGLTRCKELEDELKETDQRLSDKSRQLKASMKKIDKLK